MGTQGDLNGNEIGGRPSGVGQRARLGYFGWREFQRNRRDLLGEFDRAKEYNASRPVRTEHGNAGEAALS